MHRNLCVILISAFIVSITTAALVYQTSNQRRQHVTGEFGDVSLSIDLATTIKARELGLSGRLNVPENYGMLFVFKTPDKYGFWMKDMLVPIDIYWLGEDMRVVSFISNAATSSYPNVFYPTNDVRYVLETAAGFAGRNRVATGTELYLQNFKYVSD